MSLKSDLLHVTEEEIVGNLAERGVIDSRSIKIYHWNEPTKLKQILTKQIQIPLCT